MPLLWACQRAPRLWAKPGKNPPSVGGLRAGLFHACTGRLILGSVCRAEPVTCLLIQQILRKRCDLSGVSCPDRGGNLQSLEGGLAAHELWYL